MNIRNMINTHARCGEKKAKVKQKDQSDEF